LAEVARAGPPGAPRLVLASSSPQRRAILQSLGLRFTVRPVDVRERERGNPEQIALQNALRKAEAATRSVEARREVVLGCDTVVSLGGRIHGKPRDERAARRTLQALSGATHRVFSGVAVLGAGRPRTAVARTAVSFRRFDEQLVEWYVATGEWRGRSGGYAIQKAGSALVRAVRGDIQNVVGLPVARLLDIYPELLQAHRKDADVR
jgi:septum formation protein